MSAHALAASSPLVSAVLIALMGLRQRSQTGASWARWLAVSVGLGIIASLPIGAWVLLEALDLPFTPVGAVTAWAFAVLMCMRMVVPLRLVGRGEAPPISSAGPVVDRVVATAAQLGVPPPPVRLLGTLGQLHSFAAAVSPLRPSLLISDGILQRLKPAEADAVLGHELAHIVNGSLWLIPTAFAGSIALGVLLLGLSDPMDASGAPWLVALGCWGMVGPVYAAVSRPNERWCDLHAARAVGFAAMSSALDKIHTTLPVPLTGWRSVLVHAVATHPSRASRLAHLRRYAPAAELPALPPPEPSLALHRRAAWGAAAVWLACLAIGVMLLRQGALAAGLGVLVLPAVLQLSILLRVFLPARLAARRRLPFRVRGRWWFWGGLGMVIAVALLGVKAPGVILGIQDPAFRRFLWKAFPWVGLASTLGGFAAMVAGGLLMRGSRKLPGTVVELLARGDFLGARGKVLSRKCTDPALRYLAAVAAVAARQREVGTAELESIVAGKRVPPAAFLTLSGLLRARDPERALELARSAAKRLPADPAAHLSVAGALMALGRLDEGDAAAAAIERVPGQVGANALALRARVALSRGETLRAEALLAAAAKAAPGEPRVLVVRAQLLARSGTTGEAIQARDEAREAVRNNPLLFLDDEFDALPSPEGGAVGAG